LNNTEKIVKLIDLNERSEEYSTAVVRLKETLNNIKNGCSAKLTISSCYVADVRIPVTEDILSLLIKNEEDSLKVVNMYIDDLLNGETNELKSKISEFSNSVKEKVEEDVEEIKG
jgi:alpha-N-acetylglucosamine transferase